MKAPRVLLLMVLAVAFLFTANSVTQGAMLNEAVPLPVSEDWRYAIAQGGLFGVCLVLAWILWKVWERGQLFEKETRDRSNEREDKLTQALLEVAKATGASNQVTADNTEALREFTKVVTACRKVQQVHRHEAIEG